jgi:hypothetical protein
VDIKLKLQRAVNRANDPSVVRLQADELEAGRTYSFQVTVSNFVGKSSTARVVVTKSARPVPKVFITGGATRNGMSPSTLFETLYSLFLIDLSRPN